MRADLPEPSADELAHSERLRAAIRDEIRGSGGALRFDRYMELALYAPGLGYYSAGAEKFGAGGDFVTAPELGFVFARCLARAVAPALRARDAEILELGPGSGALAAELLLELERLDALAESLSSARAQRRSARAPALHADAALSTFGKVSIVARHAARVRLERRVDRQRGRRRTARTIVRAERKRDSGTMRRHRGERRFRLAQSRRRRDVGARRRSRSRRCATNVAATVSFGNLHVVSPWFREVTRACATARRGSSTTVTTHGEYTLPRNDTGTLRCHYRHRAHDDPLVLTGLQDITAWVDFDALADAARSAGFRVTEVMAQSQFLIENQLHEIFDDAYSAAPDEATRYRLSQEVKRLTLPSEMGETFKFAVLARC